jgi:Na+/H+ antiporter NhaC
MAVFGASVPYNLYAWMAVLLVALIALGIFPDWGPMAKAERRAQDSGQVLRPGSQPMLAEELTGLEPYAGVKTSLFWNFFFPVLVVIGFALTAVVLVGSAKPMEAFLLAVVVSAVIMRLQGFPLEEITRTAVTGVKGIMPAVIILALAYALNALSEAMQTAEVILAMTEGWLSPALLPALAFLLTGAVAFSTGTSWGTYAIMIPLALPLALGFSGEALGPLVYATLAAVAGGGVFGDHCSPLSDTSILASTGAASDHMDHVKTQLPYAFAVAGLSLGAYLLLGLTL